MSLDDLKANGYVFTANSISNVPRINVNIYSITQESMESAISVYMDQADAYASSYMALLENKEYIVDRLQKDLAAECDGLTSGGVNKEENIIVMHEKADDVYALAAKSININNVNNIRAIIENYGEIHSSICMNDEATSTSLQEIYVNADDSTYDTKALPIEFGSESRTFINDNPGYVENNRTYTAYETIIDENDKYVNTPVYSLGYYSRKTVGQSSIDGWFIQNTDNIDVAYSITIDGPYTSIDSSSSDQSSESSEYESSAESSESESSEEP